MPETGQMPARQFVDDALENQFFESGIIAALERDRGER
jgi:hypothetical protein